MLRNIVYLVAGIGSLSLLLFEAPSGALLTTAPERGKVTQDPQGKNNATVRGRGPAFIWLGGGYHGGK
jgi:hypothetical protein